ESLRRPPRLRVPLQLVDPRLNRLVPRPRRDIDDLRDRQLLPTDRARVQAVTERARSGRSSTSLGGEPYSGEAGARNERAARDRGAARHEGGSAEEWGRTEGCSPPGRRGSSLRPGLTRADGL